MGIIWNTVDSGPKPDFTRTQLVQSGFSLVLSGFIRLGWSCGTTVQWQDGLLSYMGLLWAE